MRVNHHHCRVKKVALLAFLWPSWGFKRPKYCICIVLFLIVLHGISRSSSFFYGAPANFRVVHLVILYSWALLFSPFFAKSLQKFRTVFVQPSPVPPAFGETYVNSWKKHIMVMVMLMLMLIVPWYLSIIQLYNQEI